MNENPEVPTAKTTERWHRVPVDTQHDRFWVDDCNGHEVQIRLDNVLGTVYLMCHDRHRGEHGSIEIPWAQFVTMTHRMIESAVIAGKSNPTDTPTRQQVESACMSFQHDFGLMDAADQDGMRWTATEWLHAWQKEFEKPVPDAYPIFEILPRLWAAGFRTVEQDGQWWLFDPDGECITSGHNFKRLCVNIVLAGL